jgi:oxygen-independent coproporphyrinogen-3 oxidase
LNAAERIFGFHSNIEITLEANPGAVDEKKFVDFSLAGVNRLSIGVQSFNNTHLSRLGRIHGDKEALNAIRSAQHAGFDNINVDLMHGLPEQTIEQAESDISIAVNSGAVHISWYQLTIEPNTEFFSRPPPLPVDDRLADIQHAGMILLKDNEFEQYEVSAFCKNNRPSEHNMNYWTFGDYLGIGAGAHGKITQLDKKVSIRTAKTRQPEHYLTRIGTAIVKQDIIDTNEIAVEFMMNGLRLKHGVPRAFFPRRTGLEPTSIDIACLQLQSQGLIEKSNTHYCTTELGYRFLNSVLQHF